MTTQYGKHTITQLHIHSHYAIHDVQKSNKYGLQLLLELIEQRALTIEAEVSLNRSAGCGLSTVLQYVSGHEN